MNGALKRYSVKVDGSGPHRIKHNIGYFPHVSAHRVDDDSYDVYPFAMEHVDRNTTVVSFGIFTVDGWKPYEGEFMVVAVG